MDTDELITKQKITWCPGCSNHGILLAVRKALVSLVNEKGLDVRKVVTVVGIGCHAKIFDYLKLSGFYSIHGRVLACALGIKVSNPELIVLGFGGDGDTYDEGICHFVHACRYNADVKMIVHNNQVFALTVGQATSTSERGFRGKSTPLGRLETPLNPIALALAAGATFVARGFALDVEHLTYLIKEAIQHKGFAFIDVLQPCISFHDTSEYLRKHIYKLEEIKHNFENHGDALSKALEWDYCLDEKAKIPIGIFYKVRKPTYEELYGRVQPFYRIERKRNWKEIIDNFKQT